MSILAQLINYTKNPTLETNFTVKNKVWFLIKFAGFFFLMSFLVGIPQEPLLKIVGFEAKDHFINQAISQDPYWQVFISTVLFAPFFEEISYRLWLRPTFKNLTLGLGILFSTIIGPLIPLGWIFFNLPILSVEIFTIIYFLLVSVVSISLVGVLLLIFGTTKKLNSFTSKHFKVFYYLSIVLFAFVHSFNYDISKVWFIIPIIILPQLLLGLYFGFVRMNLGLKWSIIAHSLHNFLFIFPALLASEATKSIRQQIQDSNDLIPALIYNLAQFDQNLYYFAIAFGSVLTLVSLILTIIVFFEYFKRPKSEVLDLMK